MIATREGLLQMLPEYRDEWVMIHPDQSVRDIIREVLSAHKDFAGHYDLIAPVFESGSTGEICSSLFHFCKNEIAYREESDDWQTTATPAGILSRGFGDCKHYAGFCGGVLDALNRRGKNIKWCYRFASYRVLDSTPHHVFIVVMDAGREVWIDATPEARGRVPVWQVDKKINNMALVRNIAGMDNDTDLNSITQEDLIAAVAEVDTTEAIPPEDFNAIALLISYEVMATDGAILIEKLNNLLETLPADKRDELTAAYDRYFIFSQNAVGGFFDGLWTGVKVVTLSIPRNAFLGLVALNVFGMASKMSRLLSIPDAREKLINKWISLGGRESGIVSAINSGASKKAILGCVNAQTVGVVAAVPGWLAVAGGIIAAMMPLVTSLLKSNNQYSNEFAQIDAGNYNYGATGGGIIDTIKNFIVQNPIPSAAAAALVVYLLWKD